MAVTNDTNYLNQVPLPVDYVIFIRDSDGVSKSVTFQQLAELLATLATPEPNVSVVSVNTVLSTQQQIVGNSGGAISFTLPASALNTGRTYSISNKGAGAVTVLPNGTDTIAGAASVVLAQYESVIVKSDGLGNWSTFGAP